MYSRFIVWQSDTKIENQSEIQDVNLFRLKEGALDIRFRLKGYGFKKVGETNRVIYHFGCYKCFYRKVGETEWTMFAHVQSERADGSNEATLYGDVSVNTGVLEFGLYDFKIEACKLVELSNWSGGVVEGITEGEQFYYAISARQQLPQKVGAQEDINVEEYFLQGVTPIPLFATDPDPNLFDGIQCVEIWSVVLEHNIKVSEEVIAVSDDGRVDSLIDIRYTDNISVVESWSVGPDNLFINNVGGDATSIELMDKAREEEIRKEKELFALLQEYRRLVDEKLAGVIPPDDYTVQLNNVINQGGTYTLSVDEFIELIKAKIRAIENAGYVDYAQAPDPNKIYATRDEYLFFWTIDLAKEQVYELEHIQEHNYEVQLAEDIANAKDEAERQAIQDAYDAQKAIRDAQSEAEKLLLEQKYGVYRGSADVFEVKENVHLTFYPFYSYWYEAIPVRDYIDVNIFGSRQSVDNIHVEDFLIDVNIWGHRTIWEALYLYEVVDVNVYGTFTKWETITVSDVLLDINLPFSRQSVDSIAVTEAVAVGIPFTIVFSDDITVTDVLFINIFGSTTVLYETFVVSEWIHVLIPHTVQVDDWISVTDYAEYNVIRSILAFDPIIYVTETVVVNVPFTITVTDDIIHITEVLTIWGFQAKVSDAINVTEFVAILFPYQINRFDTVGVSESVTMDAKQKLVWDTITVTEFVSLSLPSIRTVVDTVVVTEFASVKPHPLVSSIQSITVTENLSLRLTVLNLSVNDTIAITENVSTKLVWLVNVVDSVAVSEFRAVNLTVLNINKVESISVFEFVKIECLSPSVSDNILISEFRSLYVFWSLTAYDVASVAEDVSLTLLWLVNVSDSISVQENILVSMGIQRFEIINVTEAVTVIIAPREVTEDDNAWVNGALTDDIQVQEYVALLKFVVLPFNVYDSISVSEARSVSIGIAFEIGDDAGVSGALYDTVNIAEYASAYKFDIIERTVSDSIEASEDVSLVIGIAIDTPYDEAGIEGALYESVLTQEYTAFLLITYRYVSVTDDIGVIESTTLYVPTEIYGAYEEVGVFGALYETINIAEFVQLARI